MIGTDYQYMQAIVDLDTIGGLDNLGWNASEDWFKFEEIRDILEFAATNYLTLISEAHGDCGVYTSFPFFISDAQKPFTGVDEEGLSSILGAQINGEIKKIQQYKPGIIYRRGVGTAVIDQLLWDVGTYELKNSSTLDDIKVPKLKAAALTE
ncbi:hypothetical protein K435DRAFT_794821 [Dendrothele bispora CBS 962.96]|uniref:Uncharacterized protein n=1 Tax=Dendrothele bispora (strain CBS 962.96) TaxID=1314807 RepID=A0A4S8MAS6_DENBC|nr:hypothetical protein K435DRAFT_794821 [Dendrothele bispora CBS 962.96]